MSTISEMESIPFQLAEAMKPLVPDDSADNASEFFAASNRISVAALPNLKKEEIKNTTVVVSPIGFDNEEHDKGSDLAVYTMSIGVSRSVSQSVDGYQELIGLSHYVESIQTVIAKRANQKLTISVDDETFDCDLVRRSVVSNPLFDVRLLRQEGIFLSVTLAQYRIFKDRS